METPTKDLNLFSKKMTALYGGTIGNFVLYLCVIISHNLKIIFNLKIILKVKERKIDSQNQFFLLFF